MPKVTTIPATANIFTEGPVQELKKRKVAAYARVSTDREEQQSSYEAQVDYYTHYIKSRDDWEFAGIYADEGITGTSTKHREGFKSMVADALDGKIDLIITKSVSRFARNTVDSLSTIRLLKEHNIECYFEKENIWTFDGKGELLITIMSSIAQEESRSISENSTWGKRKSFADGKVSVAYSHFLGYDRGPDGKLVINPEQAVTVREIYRLFLEGHSANGIADILTKEGVKTPAGKQKWPASTVRDILTNEKYKGDALLQKTYTMDYLTKKVKINEGEVPQYYVEGDHEAIIDPKTFDLVQAEFKRRKGQRLAYMFSCRIKCGQCGSWYGPKIWHSNDKYRRTVWQCNHKFDGDEECTTPHVTEDQIEAGFVSALNQLMADKKSVIEDIDLVISRLYDTSELYTEQERLNGELAATADLVQDLIRENSRTTRNQNEYTQQYDELSRRYNQAKIDLDNIAEKIDQKERARSILSEFKDSLSRQKDVFTEFEPQAWYSLIDYVTVYTKDDIRYTFKDGTEIKI